MRQETTVITSILLLALLLAACGPTRLQSIQKRQLAASLALSRGELAEERKVIASARRDTITVTGEDGQQLILMNAIKDEDSGEMVAHDVINAAVITARFRNVAERHGRIDLRFEVIVPQEMMDTRWQLRFYPDMFILEDSVRLEPVIITGSDFRKAQIRGYELYDKYLRSIITDTTAFIDWRNLNIWIARNMPDLYKYRNDTSYVDLADFHSFYGPTQADAIREYTYWHRRHYHERRWHQRGEKFRELVKAPIQKEGIRLDTVLRDIDGNFVYQYTQSIKTRPRLRKVDIILSGDIYEQDQRLYTMPRSEPLTFYISSLSAFVDGSERYLTRVLERRAAANTACYVEFREGKWDIEPDLGHNREEMGRIRGNIRELLQNETFDVDSILISAYASPEGKLRSNAALSRQRARSVADFFDDYVSRYRDSVRRNSFTVTVDDRGREKTGREEMADIPFVSRSNGENWEMLSFLVDTDSLLTSAQKNNYMQMLEIADEDAREEALARQDYYPYLRRELYPRLRTVRFDFFLHRKGMIKDTVHTTELDTVYMKGIHYLKEREYEQALTCLKDYKDYNTAIAYLSLDYNASALAILKDLPRTPQVNYMLALLYARREDDQKAVQYYLDACREERAYVFRGNLDPEIYVLIQRYGLNRDDDTEL
ncbi:MAG: hypothetical protein IKG92_06550 [Bacteroidales bacterium]|nr:hypothetical protein [Bacteroidales bacterium]